MHDTCARGTVSGKRIEALSAENDNGINSLPDEILISILSRMKLKEAVRTCVLSQRWRYLWRFTFGSLDFDSRDCEVKNPLQWTVGYDPEFAKILCKRLRKTCVLSRIWRWFKDFNARDYEANVETERIISTNRRIMDYDNKLANKCKRFVALVTHVLELHEGLRLDSFIVHFDRGGVEAGEVLRWIYYAMQKGVKTFELKLERRNRNNLYIAFPNMKELLSLKSAFVSLRSLKLMLVDIKDEVVHYFLDSCPYLESLFITRSPSTRNLRIVDPISNLNHLVLHCGGIESVEISATSLVSFSYAGRYIKYLLKNTPNLSELTLAGDCAMFFIYEPNKHSSYSAQLVKLSLILFTTDFYWQNLHLPSDLPRFYSLKRLELHISSDIGRSLLFFTSLIKASPLLSEFRINIEYYYDSYQPYVVPFPSISEAESSNFSHKNLKLVEIVGYTGTPSEDKFILQLLKVAPSIEKVVIRVKSINIEIKCYYHEVDPRARTVEEAKERAKDLKSCFPPEIDLQLNSCI